MPPTRVVHSIKQPTGGDYTNIQSWNDAQKRNLPYYNEIAVAEIYGPNPVEGVCKMLTGWNTSRSCYIEIRAASGWEHKGTGRPTDSSKAMSSKSVVVWDNLWEIHSPKHVRFYDMQFQGQDIYNRLFMLNGYFESWSEFIFERCVFYDNVNYPMPIPALVDVTSATVIFKNCLFVLKNHHLYSFVAGGNTRVWFINCTIIVRNCSEVFRSGSTNGVIYSQNNYIYAPSGATIYRESGAGKIIKLGGDITSNSEASHPTHRNVAFDNSNFVNTTSGSENCHITKGGQLYRAADNWANKYQSQSGVVLTLIDDWEQDERAPASGMFSTPGSGWYDVGCDQIPLHRLTSLIGGYTSSAAIGAATAYFGGVMSGTYMPVPPFRADLGAYVWGNTAEEQFRYAFFGGVFKSEDGGTVPTKEFGGYVLAIPYESVPWARFGGAEVAKRANQALLGCYSLGRPTNQEFAECHNRTLVKVRSSGVIDQDLNLDAKLILKNIGNAEFNARVIWADRSDADFNAQFKVENYKIPPSVSITNCSPNNTRPKNGKSVRVWVTFTGVMGEAERWNGAQIDFGEPYNFKTDLPTRYFSTSGFTGNPPWTTFHDYACSGTYVITVRAVDNLGMVAMDAVRLNLASGVPDWKIPKIGIGATPRFGQVPDAVQVAFNVTTSGQPAITLNLYDNPTLLWEFGNGNRSQRRYPTTYYSSPGLYAPVARYLYHFPGSGIGHSGAYSMWAQDTLLIGYNR